MPSIEELSTMTKKELQSLARASRVRNYGKMNKEALITNVLNKTKESLNTMNTQQIKQIAKSSNIKSSSSSKHDLVNAVVQDLPPDMIAKIFSHVSPTNTNTTSRIMASSKALRTMLPDKHKLTLEDEKALFVIISVLKDLLPWTFKHPNAKVLVDDNDLGYLEVPHGQELSHVKCKAKMLLSLRTALNQVGITGELVPKEQSSATGVIVINKYVIRLSKKYFLQVDIGTVTGKNNYQESTAKNSTFMTLILTPTPQVKVNDYYLFITVPFNWKYLAEPSRKPPIFSVGEYWRDTHFTLVTARSEFHDEKLVNRFTEMYLKLRLPYTMNRVHSKRE
jgi:hypothetical protein